MKRSAGDYTNPQFDLDRELQQTSKEIAMNDQKVGEQITMPKTITGMPTSLRSCFQEYDFEQLNPIEHRELIVERTLAYGNRQELSWLFKHYGWAYLTTWVQQSGIHRLPWRRYNLWCVILHLPPAQRSSAQRLHSKGNLIWPH